MNNIIKELWHGNIVPQSDSRNNSPEMKQLMEYMARHHDDPLKTKTARGLGKIIKRAITCSHGKTADAFARIACIGAFNEF